mmetsp:Transcript_1199/g.4715  ORF Transcript_1199/g.4715 Transcript_1199/m.4715 type:complete len:235 (-) Transcript_1199:382-1086(-)
MRARRVLWRMRVLMGARLRMLRGVRGMRGIRCMSLRCLRLPGFRRRRLRLRVAIHPHSRRFSLERDGHQPVRGAERHAIDACARRQHVCALSCCSIEYGDAVILRPRRYVGPVGAEADAAHLGCRARVCRHAHILVEVPYGHQRVRAAYRQPRTRTIKREAVARARVAAQRVRALKAGVVKHLHPLVGGQVHQLAVARPRELVDLILVAEFDLARDFLFMRIDEDKFIGHGAHA